MSHSARKYQDSDFEIVELKNDAVTAKIAVNIGNTLFSLQQHGKEILYFPFSLEEYITSKKLAGTPFLHPWANRLAGDMIAIDNYVYLFPDTYKQILYRDDHELPLHGLLLKSTQWKTQQMQEGEQACYHMAEFFFEGDELLSFFPFRHSIRMKHELRGNTITIETTLTNMDIRPMPVSFGFHPYFLVDASKRATTRLSIPAKNVLEVNEKMIPTGKSVSKEKQWDFVKEEIDLKNVSFDHGFTKLKYEKEVAAFKINTIRIDFDKKYPFAQVYAPDQPDKPYVCIEPMTATTNALNTNDCPMIRSREKFTASFTISL